MTPDKPLQYESIERPLVSVVIATYNYGSFLAAAIDSVLRQTYPHFEIIVVNDGSTDNTDEVIKVYLNHPQLRYYKKKNEGQTKTKNFGIREAKGEYVAFLDADDFWEADKLTKQVELFNQNPLVGVVFSHIRLVGSNGEEIPSEKPKRYRGKVTPYLYGYNFICFSSSMVRKELFDKHGMFDESIKMGIDYDLWLRLSLVTEFDYVPEVLMASRIGHGQMSDNFEGRQYWARLIEEKFQKKFPGAVTEQMIKDCEFATVYTHFKRFEKTNRIRALGAVFHLFLLRPWSKTPYRSLGRLILIDLFRIMKDRS